MVARMLQLAAGLAVAARAFMIPSTMSLPGVEVDIIDIDVSEEVDGDYRIMSVPSTLLNDLEGLSLGVSSPLLEDTLSSRVYLPCPGCTFVYDEDDIPPEENTTNDIILDFELSPDRKELQLNTGRIYPPSDSADTFKVHQQTLYGGDVIMYSRQRSLGFTTGARLTTVPKDAVAVIDMFLTINDLDEERVNVDDVVLQLIQSQDGTLALVNTTIVPSWEKHQGFGNLPELDIDLSELDSDVFELSEKLVHPEDVVKPTEPKEHDSCPDDSSPAAMLCRLSAAIKQKISDWHLAQPSSAVPSAFRRPCPGRFGNSHRPTSNDEARPPFMRGGPAKFHVYTPSDRKEMHHDGPAGFLHSFANGIRFFVLGLIIPVLFGVMAGMTACLIGSLLGTFIAWFWIRFVRRGKRGTASTVNQDARSREVTDEADVLVSEKEALLDHAPVLEEGEAPPTYAKKE